MREREARKGKLNEIEERVKEERGRACVRGRERERERETYKGRV